MISLHTYLIKDGTGFRTTEYFFKDEADVLEYYAMSEPDVVVVERLLIPSIDINYEENKDEIPR